MSLTRLNFIDARASMSGWRLALAGLGLAALIGTGLAWSVQLRAVAALETRLAQATPRAPQKVSLSSTQQRDTEQQMISAAAAVRQLNVPVTRLIRALQAPRDLRVALLALDLSQKGETEQGGGTLKLAGQADSAQDIFTYVAFLNEQTLFKSVYLVKHEMIAGATESPYRFQLEARWQQ